MNFSGIDLKRSKRGKEKINGLWWHGWCNNKWWPESWNREFIVCSMSWAIRFTRTDCEFIRSSMAFRLFCVSFFLFYFLFDSYVIAYVRVPLSTIFPFIPKHSIFFLCFFGFLASLDLALPFPCLQKRDSMLGIWWLFMCKAYE